MMISRKWTDDLIDTGLTYGCDYVEIFVEDRPRTDVEMTGGTFSLALTGRDFGIGLRVMRRGRYVYAYTQRLERDHLRHLVVAASRVLGSEEHLNAGAEATSSCGKAGPQPRHHLPRKAEDGSGKVDLIRLAHRTAASEASVVKTTVRYLDECQRVTIANSDSAYTQEERRRAFLLVEVAADRNGVRASAGQAVGVLGGPESIDVDVVREMVLKACRSAVTMTGARPCPSGEMPVVISGGLGGVIFHEACGHALEGAAAASGGSIFSGKLGQVVASEAVTLVDDGSLRGGWGSQLFDDEGTPTRRNILIDKGVLRSYLVDVVTSRKNQMDLTGSSRRQSYRYPPVARMTNTFLMGGSSSPDDCLAATEYGLYAKEVGGGSVNIESGEFSFLVREGYLIEGGRVGRPILGSTLVGRAREVLRDIDMVGSDLSYGQSICRGISGAIPTSVGQPTIRVKRMLVSGQGVAR